MSWFHYQQIYFFDWFKWTTGTQERWDGYYQREPYIGVGSITNKYTSLIDSNEQQESKKDEMDAFNENLT